MAGLFVLGGFVGVAAVAAQQERLIARPFANNEGNRLLPKLLAQVAGNSGYPMETYSIVRSAGGWGISQNKNNLEGDYATREDAFEAVYWAASNDIKKGRGVSNTIEHPRADEPAMGGTP
jgi:hypothetical protein